MDVQFERQSFLANMKLIPNEIFRQDDSHRRSPTSCASSVFYNRLIDHLRRIIKIN